MHKPQYHYDVRINVLFCTRSNSLQSRYFSALFCAVFFTADCSSDFPYRLYGDNSEERFIYGQYFKLHNNFIAIYEALFLYFQVTWSYIKHKQTWWRQICNGHLFTLNQDKIRNLSSFIMAQKQKIHSLYSLVHISL